MLLKDFKFLFTKPSVACVGNFKYIFFCYNLQHFLLKEYQHRRHHHHLHNRQRTTVFLSEELQEYICIMLVVYRRCYDDELICGDYKIL